MKPAPAGTRAPSRVDWVVVLALPLLGLAVWALFRGLRVEADAWGWLTHTHEVMERLDRTLADATAAETSQRGWRITRDARMLDDRRRAGERLLDDVAQLAALTRDNPVQQRSIATLRTHLEQRLARFERSRADETPDAQEAARAAVADASAGIAAIGAQLAAMRADEERLLAERAMQVRQARDQAEAAGIVLGGLALMLMLLLRFVAARDAASIRLARERLDATLRSIGDAVIATDARGHVEMLNPVAERLTGWSEAEARGRPFDQVFRIVDETTRAPLEGPLGPVLREGRTVALSNHTLLLSRDGRSYVIEDSGAPIRRAGCAIDGAVLVFVDATARRAAERERAQLAALVEQSIDFIGIADLDGRLVYLNPAARRLTGIDDDVRRHTLLDVVASSARERFEREYLPRVREAGIAEDEMRLRNVKTGEERDVSRITFLLRLPEGDAFGFGTITRDLTETKRTLASLERAEARERATADRYRQVLEALPQLVWTCAATGEADFLSGQWLAYTGTALEDNLGYAWLECVHPDDRPTLVARWQAALKAGGVFDAETRLRRADGAWRWFKQRAVALKRADGTVERWFGTSTDITDLVAARDAVRQANADLEGRVAERTRRLGEANAELQSFAHTVAHDLRAPLRNIEGFAAALLEDEVATLSPDGADYARRIAAGATRMDALITDLLAYSRLSRSELQLEPVDVGLVVGQVLGDLAGEIHRTGAEVQEPACGALAVAHAQTLRQVLDNLVANALKFVPRGVAPRIAIGCEVADGSVRITVADNGIGIAPEHQERVFGVFERLHAAEQYPGTGIGLAIVRRGVERMNGRLSLTSAAGAGARFEITLPLAMAEASREAA